MMFFMFIMLSLVFVMAVALGGAVFSVKSFKDRELLSSFECGYTSFVMGRQPFSLRFFMVAMVFLIFDVELILLFPFLLSIFPTMGGLHAIMLFSVVLGVLTLGLFYEWNMMALSWNNFD